MRICVRLQVKFSEKNIKKRKEIKYQNREIQQLSKYTHTHTHTHIDATCFATLAEQIRC